MVGHHAGEGVDGFQAHQAGPPLGLDEAHTAEEQVLAGGDRIHAAVLGRHCSPCFGTHRGEQVLDEVLELGG